jgi:hypothetical protein
MYYAVKYPDGNWLAVDSRLRRLRARLAQDWGIVVIFDDRGRSHGWYDTSTRRSVRPQSHQFAWCPIRRMGYMQHDYS